MDNDSLLSLLLVAGVAFALVARLAANSGRHSRSETDTTARQERDDRDTPRHRIAKVYRVLDGDTVIVNSSFRSLTLRLDSIDCPEGDQQWGDIAKYGLIKLIGGRSIRFECHGRDRYGRTVATIYVRRKDNGEWQNVNARMVTLGHAWVYRQHYGHLPPERRDELNRLERWARSKRVGLWKHPNPMPPWQWRNGAS